MTEKTLVLIKPDGVQRGKAGEILKRFEEVGLKIVALKMIQADKALAKKHYTADEAWLVSVGNKKIKAYAKDGIKMNKTAKELGLKVRSQLLDYLTISPLIAIVLEGHNAVRQVRKMVGVTCPEDAAPGTIRGDYSFDTFQLTDLTNRPIQNLIHASGEIEEAKHEIAIWFKKEEIYSWQRADEGLLYRNNNSE